MDIIELITWFVIIIFVLFLIYRFRKIIVLSVIRLVYGQYSYEFLNTYKKFFVRSPFHYCFRDDFITHLLFAMSKNEEIPSYKSKEEIEFENTPYFIHYKDFLKKKGSPYCFNAFVIDKLHFEIKSLGYQSTITGSKAVTLFYFINDSFFMGEYIFKNPKTDVKAVLINDFLNIPGISDDNFYIENANNLIIHFQNTGFIVDVKYLNIGDNAIIDSLKGYYNYITGKKPVMKF